MDRHHWVWTGSLGMDSIIGSGQHHWVWTGSLGKLRIHLAKPRVSQTRVRSTIHRNIYKQPIMRGREHLRLTFQLNRFTILLERSALPVNRVVASQISADRSTLERRHSV